MKNMNTRLFGISLLTTLALAPVMASAQSVGDMATDWQSQIGNLSGAAIALAFLVPWFLYAIIAASRSGHDGAIDFLAQPWNAILMILALGAAFYHMRLGVQVVVEDYIGKAGMKQGLLILNTFICIGLFAATALSVLKVWISAGV